MADIEKIKAALAQLDPLDDDLWTADGTPKIEIVSGLVGEVVKRQEIINALPDFNRETAGKPKGDEQSNEVVDQVEDEVDLEPFNREMSTTEFMVWIRTVQKEELENIESALKNQNDEIGAEIKKLQDLQKRITQAISITRIRIKEAFPNSVNQSAIRDFITSQAKSRAERVESRQTILKGIKPDELDHRSPLDLAMARKTKRGTQRPIRPFVK